MSWHQYLRDDRARKLHSIEMLAARDYTISRTEGGRVHILNDEIISDYKDHIAEIEQLLTEAGEPFDA